MAQFQKTGVNKHLID